MDFSIYSGKRVLITGNSGFKGSWLSQWLLHLGAKVSGLALEPPTSPSVFDQLELNKSIEFHHKDIRHYDSVKQVLSITKPEIIFHLAAQSLVRESYSIPIETVETNVMGTAYLLEAVRDLRLNTTVIIITSDKSYENREWLFGYREVDAMGGYDPYSASKGAAELITSSWRRSFFHPENFERHGVKVASVRAGNVIGGGDWAKDRIVPDCIRSLQNKTTIQVRNPLATRPWQHVLEPLGGYLLLGAKLLTCENKDLSVFCDGFNFGPLIGSNKSVRHLVDEILINWGEGDWDYNKEDAMHEASLLNLTIDKAYHLLKWHPVWDFQTTINKTVAWYKMVYQEPEKARQYTEDQINEYQVQLFSTIE